MMRSRSPGASGQGALAAGTGGNATGVHAVIPPRLRMSARPKIKM